MSIKRVKSPDRERFSGGGYTRGDNPVPEQLRNSPGKEADVFNGKQAKFVDYYTMGDTADNAWQSALKAGYKNGNYSYQLLGMPKVIEAIEQRRAELKAKADDEWNITADRVLKELAYVAFSNMGDYFDDWGFDENGRFNAAKAKSLTRLTKQQLSTVSSVKESLKGNQRTFSFQLHSKLQALQLLTQYLGLLDGAGKTEDPNSFAQQLREAAAGAVTTLPGNGDDNGSVNEEDTSA